MGGRCGCRRFILRPQVFATTTGCLARIFVFIVVLRSRRYVYDQWDLVDPFLVHLRNLGSDLHVSVPVDGPSEA